MQALNVDCCRAWSGNFIVPEPAAGFGAQPGFSTMNPEPGEMRRMALSSVSRGADGVLFFRWRPAHFKAEIYRMGLIDHDDVPRRRCADATQFFGEMNRLVPEILGTHVRMDLGIAGADFDNQEACKTYGMGLPSPLEDATILHRTCYQQGMQKPCLLPPGRHLWCHICPREQRFRCGRHRTGNRGSSSSPPTPKPACQACCRGLIC